MNTLIFEGLTACTNKVTGYRPKVSDREEQFHVYVPAALIIIMKQYAETLRWYLKQSKLDFKKESRIISDAIRDHDKRWCHNMTDEKKEKFIKIADEIRGDVDVDFTKLLFVVDNNILQLSPDCPEHLTASYAETVAFLCTMIEKFDKESFNAIDFYMGRPRGSWFVDASVFRIKNTCRLIAFKILGNEDAVCEVNKNMITQVELATKAIKNRIKNYEVVL